MISTCKHCNGHTFELAEQAPNNAAYKMFFVQCAICGQPIGVLEYYTGWVKMSAIEDKIKKLETKIDYIDHLLRTLIQQLQNR